MDMHEGRPTSRLLNLLSGSDRALLDRSLKDVPLGYHDTLERPGEKMSHAYFLVSGMVSSIAISQDHRVEVGMTGHEGMIGVGLLLGVDRAVNEAIVQSPGRAWRISAGDLAAAMEASATLRAMLLRYVQVFSVQSSQTALANGLGRIDERLARWILMWSDRLRSDELPITHEFLGLLLGIRRASATVALHVLEGKQLIRSERGTVRVLDRGGLQEAAKGFYGVPEAQYERIMGATF